MTATETAIETATGTATATATQMMTDTTTIDTAVVRADTHRQMTGTRPDPTYTLIHTQMTATQQTDIQMIDTHQGLDRTATRLTGIPLE